MKKVLLPSLLISLATIAAAQSETDAARIFELPSPGAADPRLMVRVDNRKLASPKISPKHKWQFDFISAAYGRIGGPPEPYRLKFRVYSQFRKTEGDSAIPVTTMLARLWDYNAQRLGVDHSEYYGAFVDVYLCFGGKAGGEQLFDEDDRGGKRTNVNTIYIYDITSFSDPLEMAREVAHEYGHATLPPVGGFETPESWGNGFLGEALYMTWLRQDLAAKKLAPSDACGASVEALDRYHAANVQPKLAAVQKSGPDWDALASGKNMDAFLGVALLAESVLPSLALARAMGLNSKATGTGFAEAVVEAAQEVPSWSTTAGSTPIFLPVGNGKVSGGKVLSSKRGWSKVQPLAKVVSVTNTPKVESAKSQS